MAKNFKDAFNNIKKLVDKLTDKSNMEKVGEETVKMVRKRTQLGYGSNKGKKEKLEALSDAYKKQRKRLKKKGKLSKNTSAGKSNLTQSGDMLKDLDFDAKDNEVTIDFASELSKKKAVWVTDGDRPFLALTKQEIKRITKYLQDMADKLIKKS